MGTRQEREAAAARQRKYLERCAGDMRFWAEGECVIQTKGRETAHLKANLTQNIIQDAIERQVAAGLPVRVVILKGRQQGVTTWGQGLLLHGLLHREGLYACTVAHNELAVNKLQDRIFGKMVAGLEDPYELKRGKGDMWSNGSMSSVLTAGSRKIGRGDTYQFVHGTEVAYWHRGDLGDEAADAAWAGLMNGVPDLPGTTVFMESTADGAQGAFHDVYWGAKRGKMPGWTAVMVPYYKHEEYKVALTADQDELNKRLQVAWREGQEAKCRSLCDDLKLDDDERAWRLGGGQNGEPVPLACLMWRRRYGLGKSKNDPELFKQEYPANDVEAFLSSGRPSFDQRVLEGWRKALETFKTYRHETLPHTQVWMKPVAGHVYTIGVDVCEGSEVPDDETDSTAGIVYDRTSKAIVAAYHSQATPRIAAEHVAGLAWEYGAEVIPESNGPGETFIDRLSDKTPRVSIYAREVCKRTGDVPKLGWKTDSKSRPAVLTYLRDRVRKGSLIVPFESILDEMAVNITTRGRSDHRKGYHDDFVIATALALVRDKEETEIKDAEIAAPERVDPAKQSCRPVTLDIGWEWERQEAEEASTARDGEMWH
jgi:hypothetical protein